MGISGMPLVGMDPWLASRLRGLDFQCSAPSSRHGTQPQRAPYRLWKVKSAEPGGRKVGKGRRNEGPGRETESNTTQPLAGLNREGKNVAPWNGGASADFTFHVYVS